MEYWLQRLTVYTITVIGFAVAITFGVLIGDQNYMPIAIVLAFFAFVFFMAYDTRVLWILIYVGYTLNQRADFLPVNFTYFEIAILAVFGHYLLSRVAFKKEWFDIGSPPLAIFMGLFLALVFFHWFKQGIGLKLLGSESVGARKSFSIVVGVVAYVLVVTLAKGRVSMLNKIPLIGFFVGLAASIPSLAFAAGSAGELETGEARIGGYSAIGMGVITWILCCYPMKDWWRPSKWWVAALAITSLILTAESGFRNHVAAYIVVLLVGTVASLGFRSLICLVPMGMVLAILCFGQGVLFDLPYRVQRSLSFLPGHWSEDVIESTETSNLFRDTIKDIYKKEFAKRSPWIGSGFNFSAKEISGVLAFEGASMTYYDLCKGYIIRKDFHVGWISLWDTYGLYGYIFYTGIALTELYYAMQCWLFCRKLGRMDPIVIWLLCAIISGTFGYFVTFGAIHMQMPQMCLTGALVWCAYCYLKDEVAQKRRAAALPAPAPEVPSQAVQVES